MEGLSNGGKQNFYILFSLFIVCPAWTTTLSKSECKINKSKKHIFNSKKTIKHQKT